MHEEISSVKLHPFCLSLNELIFPQSPLCPDSNITQRVVERPVDSDEFNPIAETLIHSQEFEENVVSGKMRPIFYHGLSA